VGKPPSVEAFKKNNAFKVIDLCDNVF
jgi:hypothetical protein